MTRSTENTLFEQDIINAVCVAVADKNHIGPDFVKAGLVYDDETGFGAEAETSTGKREDVSEPQLIQAIRQWLESEYNIDPFSVSLELQLDEQEGIICIVD